MLFSKFAALALLVTSSVAAEDRSLRASRALTVCPTEPVDLDCTVLIDKSGTGFGPWSEVAVVSSPDTLALASYDPKGCYNVKCTTSDAIDSTHIAWNGIFNTTKATNKFKSWKAPYFLSGAGNGNGCTTFAPTCADFALKVQSNRSPVPGTPLTDQYICASLDIKCKTPPVAPPVRPPVAPPVKPPVKPPVAPPVKPPVKPPVAPPVKPPVAPPVKPPVRPPVAPPVKPPVKPPVAPPVKPPVAPPVKPPVACYDCKGDLVDAVVCPTGPADCKCPPGQEPTFMGSVECKCIKRVCPSDPAKSVMYRLKSDGKCEEKCVPPKDFAKKVTEGFDFCPCSCPPSGGGGGDVCDVCEKPVTLVFKYTPSNDVVANSQGPDKSSVTGKVDGDQAVYIICGEALGQSAYFGGNVAADQEFTITNAPSTFRSNTYCQIFASQGGAVLQSAKIHTSCSAPIVENDQFGALQLVGYLGEKSTNCGFGAIVGGTSSVGGSTGASGCGTGTPGSDICDTCEKPISLEFQYTPDNDVIANSQGPDKSSVTGKVNGDTEVYIVAGDAATQSQYFKGVVLAGSKFVVKGLGTTFRSNTYFTIYASQGGTLLQSIKFHTSCSAPIVEGDQFGSIKLTGYVGDKSTSTSVCGFGGLPVPF